MSTPELSPDELTELLTGLTPEIPDCRVMRLIGRGGMSFVYLGVQESLDRQVAIKVIAPHALKDEVSKARFEREARTIAKLQHPCIVGIYAVGRNEQGLLFYVLPYLAKGHLGQRDLTRDDGAVIEVVRAMLWALDYAHAHGVVHRDVKAENVLFDNADRPLLADFGIAATKRDRSRLTGDGMAVGSVEHMAPEQARAETVDGRADLYSLGVLTFEMVTGHLPFRNPDALGLAVMHAIDPVPRLPAAKQHWQAFIDKAMEKHPGDRFQDAREMMAALERVVDQVRRQAEQPIAPRPGRMTWAREHVRALGLAAALVVGIGAVITFWPARAPSPEVASTNEATAVSTAPVAEPTPIAVSTAVAETTPDETLALEPALAAPEPEVVELAPGEHELAAAETQIMRRRLTQPPNDNAFDSLRAARRILPQDPRLARSGHRWLEAATPYISNALGAGQDANARGLHTRATTLADELQLRGGPAWVALENTVASAISARLQTALAQRDLAALRRAKSEATQWGVTPARLEPYWSQSIVSAQPGDVLRQGRTAMVLARLPAGERPGLAVLPHAVTRAEYAAFVAATGHASVRCRIRTAAVTLRKRSWDRPGFTQQGDHPVVCISAADATAYADWLGARDGQRYRLPSAEEWRSLTQAGAAANCGPRCAGTSSIGTAAGIRQHLGSAREWSADCSDGCKRRLALGTSWRDASGKSPARGAEAIDAGSGYDDIGFRLLRSVSVAEVQQR